MYVVRDKCLSYNCLYVLNYEIILYIYHKYAQAVVLEVKFKIVYTYTV